MLTLMHAFQGEAHSGILRNMLMRFATQKLANALIKMH